MRYHVAAEHCSLRSSHSPQWWPFGRTACAIPSFLAFRIAARLSGEPPFQRSDYFLFGERDAEHHPDKYMHPDFWLYFPTDIRVQFDHPAPTCREDNLDAVLRWIAMRRTRRTKFASFRPSTSYTRPGEEIMFAGLLSHLIDRNYRVEVMHRGIRVADLNFNCIYSNVLGTYRIPLGAKGVLTFSARLIGSDGSVLEGPPIAVRVDASGPAAPPVLERAPQPTASELIALMPGIEIAERGDNYVIFDLRPYYAEHRL